MAAGSIREKEPLEIEGTGYVVQTLEAALEPSTAPGASRGDLAAVNLGNGADTRGALFGASEIPERWLVKAPSIEEIAEMVERLRDGQLGT